jgi:thiol-disulfide isomerase/thioredoxin
MLTIARRRAAAALFLVAIIARPAWAQAEKKANTQNQELRAPQPVTHTINGRVIDLAGKPLAGVPVSRFWHTGANGAFTPYQAVKTAANGTFAIEITFHYGRPEVLAALDLGHAPRQGGLVSIEPGAGGNPVTITAGNLVHLHGSYACKELGKPVGWTNTMVMAMPGGVRFAQYASNDSTFDFWLPPGSYQLRGYGTSDVGQYKHELTLSADTPELALGAIDLAASKIARLTGKPAPALLPTDTRGVSKSVQIADYHGKWVALEFWGYWCGPCVGRALPQMMEIYDDHSSERDKFVILTVHSPETKTFTELDEKVKPVVRDVWAGRMIPFPILLDGDSKLQETFGVSHWPTTLLFDPEGKLVGEVQPEALEGKLTKVPAEIALPRKLDRNISIGFNDNTLGDALKLFRPLTGAKFELDKEALTSLGLSESSRIPLTFTGMISLRSMLDLVLDPLELTARIGPDGYVITRKTKTETSSEPGLSGPQEQCAARIERKLKESRYTFQFDKKPLASVAAFFEEQSGENVVLDPRGRMQGKIDPSAPVTMAGKEIPLGEALAKLAEPLGLRVVVRDEVIVLESK